ncbi:MAG: hypothetical protein Q9215_007799 [Flavoplaca cf. flavocitrina]
MNWQNVNSDVTWASVTNWYWRSWEVSVGIVAASIPALRPRWRVVSSGINTYLSHRFSRPETDKASFIKQPYNNNRKASHDAALEAATHTASNEAHEAQAYGAGEAGLAMKNLPGDVGITTGGIRKTTTIDVEDGRSRSSERSFLFDNYGSGAKNKYFL